MSRESIFFIELLLIHLIFGQLEIPQSHIVISDLGYYFKPAQATDWRNDLIVSTFEECVRRCNEDYVCRTFDYNFDSNRCRLFEVDSSPGQIANDPSLRSQVGQVQLLPDFYRAINQTCNHCNTNRYLTCIDDLCQCPWNTFWNGLICEKERYAGEFCTNNKQCRTDTYHLTCVSTKVCTSKGWFTLPDNNQYN